MSKESHNYDHSHEHNSENNLQNILITFWLNLIFATVELLGAIFSNSISLYSNAIHDYGDSIILLSTLFIERHSYKGRSMNYTYGYRRYSLVGAIINNLILLSASLFITYEAIGRFLNPQEISTRVIFGIAILGIVVNTFGYMRLKQNESEINKSLQNNLFADILSWVGLLVSSVIMALTGWYVIDGLISLFIAITMFYAATKQFRTIFNIIMQKVPDTIDLLKIEQKICEYPQVINCHDVHIWTLDGEDYIMTMHIVVENEMKMDEVMEMKEEIKLALERLKINHTTIEVDSKAQAIKNGELTSETK